MTGKYRFSITVLAMLLACTMLFTACDKVSVKDVEKDPAEQLIQSAKTTSTTVADNCTPLVPLKAALNKGSVALELDNDEIGKLAATLYSDSENETAALDFNGEFEDGDLGFKLYAADKKLAIESEKLFDGAYGVDLATLTDDLKDSELLEEMGVTYEDLPEALTDMLEEIEKAMSEDEASVEADLKELKKAIKEKLNSTDVTVAKEKIEIGGETEVKAIVMTYAFDGEALYDMIEIVADWTVDTVGTDMLAETYGYYDVEDFEEECDEVLADIKETFDNSDLDITLKVALNPKTTDVMRVDFSMAGEMEGSDGEITALVDFGKNPEKSEKWVIEVDIEGEDDFKAELDVDIERIDNDETFSRTIDITYSEDDDKNELSLYFEHNKKDKTYTAGVEENDDKAEVEGTLEYDEKSFTMTVDTVEIDGGEEIEIGFKLTAKAEDKVPDMPEFENFLKLDSDKLEDLFTEIEENAEEEFS